MTRRSPRLATSLLALAACGGAPSQPAAPAPAATPVSPDPAVAPPGGEPAPAPPAGPGKKRPTEPGPHQTTYGVVFNFRPDGGGSGKRIYLAGSFNGWKPSDAAYLLRDDDGDGMWSITVKLPAGTYQYKYVIDGTTWIQDPYAPDGFGGRNGQFDVQ